MIEMLKSKTIIAFIIIVLGATFISVPSNKLDINNNYNVEINNN